MTRHFDYHPSIKDDDQSARSSVPVVSRWLWPGNGTFLEVASMVGTWWIVAFLHSAYVCKLILLILLISLHRGEKKKELMIPVYMFAGKVPEEKTSYLSATGEEPGKFMSYITVGLNYVLFYC